MIAQEVLNILTGFSNLDTNNTNNTNSTNTNTNTNSDLNERDRDVVESMLGLKRSIRDTDPYNPANSEVPAFNQPIPLFKPNKQYKPENLVIMNKFYNEQSLQAQQAHLNLSQLDHIYRRIKSDPVISNWNCQFNLNTSIIIYLPGYKIKITEEYLSIQQQQIMISLTDFVGNLIEIPEIGFPHHTKTTSSINDLINQIHNIIKSDYNMKCYHQTRILGNYLKQLNKYEVHVGSRVVVSVRCHGVQITFKLSYPHEYIGNRGIKWGDPENPIIILATIINYDMNKLTRKIKIKFINYKFNSFHNICDFFENINLNPCFEPIQTQTMMYPSIPYVSNVNNLTNLPNLPNIPCLPCLPSQPYDVAESDESESETESIGLISSESDSDFSKNKKYYHCNQCKYKCKQERGVKYHKLRNHATIEERKNECKYYCTKCDFGTNVKKSFDIHLDTIKHKN